MTDGRERAESRQRKFVTESVLRLVGVYDADGTRVGELAYIGAALLGRKHCGLCDITHGLLRERADWRACRVGLRVPFETFHRNDQPSPVRAAAGGVTPVVVAQTTGDYHLLLAPDDLRACNSEPERLVRAIEDKVQAAGWNWAASSERSAE